MNPCERSLESFHLQMQSAFLSFNFLTTVREGDVLLPAKAGLRVLRWNPSERGDDACFHPWMLFPSPTTLFSLSSLRLLLLLMTINFWGTRDEREGFILIFCRALFPLSSLTHNTQSSLMFVSFLLGIHVSFAWQLFFCDYVFLIFFDKEMRSSLQMWVKTKLHQEDVSWRRGPEGKSVCLTDSQPAAVQSFSSSFFHFDHPACWLMQPFLSIDASSAEFKTVNNLFCCKISSQHRFAMMETVTWPIRRHSPTDCYSSPHVLSRCVALVSSCHCSHSEPFVTSGWKLRAWELSCRTGFQIHIPLSI